MYFCIVQRKYIFFKKEDLFLLTYFSIFHYLSRYVIDCASINLDFSQTTRGSGQWMKILVILSGSNGLPI